MKLFDRVARLLMADAHGVLDSVEDRALLLKQYLREAEIALERTRARLDALREDEKRIGGALARCDDEVRALDADIALALSGGKDDLARFAIRRLLPRRAEAAAWQAQLEQRRRQAEELSERIAAQQRRFDELRGRVRAELAHAAAQDPAPGWACPAAVAEEEVELELMRRRQAAGARP